MDDPFSLLFNPQAGLKSLAEKMDQVNKVQFAQMAAILTLLLEKGIISEEDCERVKQLTVTQLAAMDQLYAETADKEVAEYKKEHASQIELLQALGMWKKDDEPEKGDDK